MNEVDIQTLELAILQRRENIYSIINKIKSYQEIHKNNENKLNRKARLSSLSRNLENVKRVTSDRVTSRKPPNQKTQSLLNLPMVSRSGLDLNSNSTLTTASYKNKRNYSGIDALKTIRSDLSTADLKSKRTNTLDQKILPAIPISYKRGELPKYLISKKEELKKEEERLAEEKRINCPPGHSLLPEAKRLETLKMLTEKREHLNSEIRILPVRNDTLRLKNLRSKLEADLTEIEEGIRTFSRPKVFVCSEN